MKTKLEIPATLYRAASFERTGEGDGALVLTISTDAPYKRRDYKGDEYWEVLDHGQNGVDEERLRSPGLPILFNHDTDLNLANARQFANDGHKITLPEKGFIWAAGDMAENKRKDVESGALPHCSVGYEVAEQGVQIGERDGIPIVSFAWKVFEASVVPVPADAKAASNRRRELEQESGTKEIEITPKKVLDETLINENNGEDSQKSENPMKKRNHLFEADKGDNATTGAAAAELTKAEQKGEEKGAGIERNRVNAINDHSKQFAEKGFGGRKIDTAELAAQHIRDGKSVQDFKDAVMAGTFSEVKAIETPDNDGRIEVIGDRGQLPANHRGLSIGAQFIRSQEVKSVKGGKLPKGASVGMDIDFSAIGIHGKVALAHRAGFTSSDLSAVNVTIGSGILTLGVQRLTVMDVIGTGSIGTGSYKYARENGFGTIDGIAVAAGAMPRAKSVGERGLKPTWEPDLSTETANVSKVAITTKVPDEFLSDFPSAMSYLDERMPLMVDTETEFQILYGDGLNNNLKGIFTTAGVQTRPIVTTDDSTKAASIRQGITDIQVGAQFEPDFIGFHPYDWETASLLKDSTGRFLAGGPYYVPYADGVYQERYTFWGKPVVISTAISYGRPICGAGKLGAAALIREGMRIEMTNSNEDDFRRNLIALRAEHRLALPVYRPVAFLEFTGWPARA